LNFGSQKVGSQSQPQTVTATNVGASAVTFFNVAVSGRQSPSFSEASDCTAQALQPGASCTATVTFNPTATGTLSANLFFTLKNQGAANPQPVTLTGTGD
jgi:hypothetical protein